MMGASAARKNGTVAQKQWHSFFARFAQKLALAGKNVHQHIATFLQLCLGGLSGSQIVPKKGTWPESLSGRVVSGGFQVFACRLKYHAEKSSLLVLKSEINSRSMFPAVQYQCHSLI